MDLFTEQRRELSQVKFELAALSASDGTGDQYAADSRAQCELRAPQRFICLDNHGASNLAYERPRAPRKRGSKQREVLEAGAAEPSLQCRVADKSVRPDAVWPTSAQCTAACCPGGNGAYMLALIEIVVLPDVRTGGIAQRRCVELMNVACAIMCESVPLPPGIVKPGYCSVKPFALQT